MNQGVVTGFGFGFRGLGVYGFRGFLFTGLRVLGLEFRVYGFLL